jgi:hypothetical protein
MRANEPVRAIDEAGRLRLLRLVGESINDLEGMHECH